MSLPLQWEKLSLIICIAQWFPIAHPSKEDNNQVLVDRHVIDIPQLISLSVLRLLIYHLQLVTSIASKQRLFSQV